MKSCIGIFPIVCAFSAVALFSVPSTAKAEEQCVKDAWAAYNSKNYTAAIAAADNCIDDFGRRAEREEAALKQKSEPQPPTGKVDSASERNAIFARWAINDVSTAYFIKGRSAEFLYIAGAKAQKVVAEKAYQGAINLSCGRVFDPRGWFWSPKEAAEERLPLK
jgi:hypothetical protein